MKNSLRKIVFGGLLVVLCATFAPAQQTSSGAECAELKTRVEQLEARQRDWAQTERYREANAQLAAPVKNEQRVVFIGDSITDWWDDDARGNKFFPGKPYVNRGIGGQITPQMLVRFHQDVIALQPKAVVILAGTNDLNRDPSPAMLEQIKSNISAMADLARAHNIKVVLSSLLPVNDEGRDRAGKPVMRTDRRPPAMLRQLNEWMQDYAKRNNHTYLDYHTALVNDKGLLKTELSDDGLHANPKGYAVMAPLAEAAVNRALKK